MYHKLKEKTKEKNFILSIMEEIIIYGIGSFKIKE